MKTANVVIISLMTLIALLLVAGMKSFESYNGLDCLLAAVMCCLGIVNCKLIRNEKKQSTKKNPVASH